MRMYHCVASLRFNRQTAEYHEYCVHGLFHVRGRTTIHMLCDVRDGEESNKAENNGDVSKRRRVGCNV